MNLEEKRRIPWLDVLRLVGVFGVIVMHVSARVLPDRGDVSHPYWWTWALLNASVLWCVPVFVMISGAVLLPNGRNESCGQFYRRRAARLLVPLFAWSLVYSALRYMQGSEGDSVAEILLSIFEGRPYSHLWFLYMIVLLSVFTPMLRTFVAAATVKERQILLVLCVALATLDSLYTRIYSPIGHTVLREFMPFLGYYLLGYEISRSERRGPACALLVLLIAVSVAAVATVPYALL
ncbi:MAG: acyltransferase family protein, partial [Lentisphaerae bacterium]|nr:acyltransferase family protein [Lentisphaerota bacterium]